MTDEIVFAPVIIPTLSRDKHLIRCIESLKKCKYASKTEIFISVDFPVHEKYKKGYLNIKNYLSSEFHEFKKVHIYYQTQNLGAMNNIEFLFDRVSVGFDRFILSEDDNEFSYNCLEYLNKGLMLFEKDENVLNICSVQEDGPWKNMNETVMYIQSCPAYGLGCWVEKEKKLRNIKKNYFMEIGMNFSKIWKLFKTSKLCWQQLIEGILWKNNPIFSNGDTIYWCDTMRSIYAINENKYFIAPQISKVRNWGFDGSGQNMKKTDIDPLDMWTLDQNKDFEYKVNFREERVEQYNKYIDSSGCRIAKVHLMIATIKYILFRLKGRLV